MLLDQRLGLVRARGFRALATIWTRFAAHAVRAELSRIAKKKAKASYTIDPALIGGVVARVGLDRL